MVHNSWNVPTVATPPTGSTHCPLWGSVRLTFTICCFFANFLQMCLRNMLGLVILRMVKARPEDALLLQQQQLNNLTTVTDCGNAVLQDASIKTPQTGDLLWSRNQELSFPGLFYYGYVFALPLAGHLADRFGGKTLFVQSLTLQGIAYLLLPVAASYSFVSAAFILILAGTFASCSSPPMYQLFVVWAHPTERTALLSFAYGGLIFGSICIYPLSNFLSDFGWKMPFYVLGCITLLYGLTCKCLIYNTLDQHPRLKKAEREYLQPSDLAQAPQHFKVPWRSLMTSMPVYAFVLTHVFHNYGFLVLCLNMPRFMREAMQFNMKQIGFLSAAPFVGSLISKLGCVLTCSYIERRCFAHLSLLRRILYTLSSSLNIIFISIIIFAHCDQMILVLAMYILLGITSDLGFSGYWPTLLYFAPSFSGLISGLANCIAHISGFVAPHIIATLVHSGNKSEWNYVLLTLIFCNVLAIIVFGIFSRMKIQPWDPRAKPTLPCTANNRNQNNNLNL